eukprot:750654-Hanusia_phi.AAC.5
MGGTALTPTRIEAPLEFQYPPLENWTTLTPTPQATPGFGGIRTPSCRSPPTGSQGKRPLPQRNWFLHLRLSDPMARSPGDGERSRVEQSGEENRGGMGWDRRAE